MSIKITHSLVLSFKSNSEFMKKINDFINTRVPVEVFHYFFRRK